MHKVNGFEREFPNKKNYDLPDLIAYAYPNGGGVVYCIFESKNGLLALQNYNDTTDQGANLTFKQKLYNTKYW
jgi:hypothetical protein